jgi:hypothetical protein
MIGRQNVASRGTVGAAILAAHLGLVALLVTSGVIKTPTLAPSVNVTSSRRTSSPNDPTSSSRTWRT